MRNKNLLICSLSVVLAVAISISAIFLPSGIKTQDKASKTDSVNELNFVAEEPEYELLSKTTSLKTNTTSKTTSSIHKNNLKMNINDNVFMDSLIYTGYNIKKHRRDNLMWVYVLASQKRGKGWLSDIGYGGGSSGYETKNGKPNISQFERGGLVCASYVTYVYFNYLPNVAGINTSMLDKPKRSYDANEWYIAAKKWVKKGYSETIGFTANRTPSNFISFKANKKIPIGSVIAFCDARNKSDHCSHVCIYAGYKNGYNWVYQVGNSNGPEFCAIERFHFGPDPQWPIKVFSTPKNIRFTPSLKVTIKDNKGKNVKGVKLTLKNLETKKSVKLTSTDSKGISLKEGLDYTKYQLTVTAPKGYTLKNNKKTIKLNAKNNSVNNLKIVLQKKSK